VSIFIIYIEVFILSTKCTKEFEFRILWNLYKTISVYNILFVTKIVLCPYKIKQWMTRDGYRMLPFTELGK
jgi:hypothetical protein